MHTYKLVGSVFANGSFITVNEVMSLKHPQVDRILVASRRAVYGLPALAEVGRGA
jgi:hypothetical protein